ncbi:MAG TPA: FtsX-like permease family protein [Polyangiaceae bacterium]|nr:FtsX-like permease family protein [Polyangiaceae bacterium]
MIFRLALRNSWRNGRRTALAGLAIATSFALLLVFLGFGDGIHEKMADIGVRMGLGDVLVEAEGHDDSSSLDHLVAGADALRAELLAVPGVEEVAVRLRTDALITAGATSVGVSVSGVDPEVEPRISAIDTPRSMIAGAALSPEIGLRPKSQLPPIVIGRDLARALGAGVGDRVTLTLRPAGGGDTESGAYEVHGIFATGVRDVDAFWTEIPLADARRIVGADGRASVLSVFLGSISDTAEAAPRIARALEGRGVVVRTWMQAAPDLYSFIVVDEGGLYAMMAIVFVVVAAGILNTLLMSILERTQEFGVLLALGATPSRVVGIVLGEALVLGLVSGATGLAVGLAVNHHFATVGVDLGAFLDSSYETSGVLMPKHVLSHLYPEKVWWSSVVILGLVMAGALYPALRAARLEPMEAIRHE